MAENMLLSLTVLFFCDIIGLGESGPLGWPTKGDLYSRSRLYMKSNPETLEELMSEDKALVEGDLLMSICPEQLKSNRNAVADTWPSHNIAYEISPGLVHRTGDLVSAMEMLSENTCLSFHQRTSERDYLYFEASDGCASYVGFIGGEQSVYIGSVCGTGNIVHEILHALGFHHEHTRFDRGEHIMVLHQNIMAGKERNFEKQEGETFQLPYDIKSILHYGSYFFSSNGKPTIVPKDEQVQGMGQREYLTPMDVKRIRHLYSCDPETKEDKKEAAALESQKLPES